MANFELMKYHIILKIDLFQYNFSYKFNTFDHVNKFHNLNYIGLISVIHHFNKS